MKYSMDLKNDRDLSYYENKYDTAGRKGIEIYNKILMWISDKEDPDNEYIIAMKYDSVINFTLKNQQHKALDITFFNDNDVKICFNVLSYKNNLSEIIDINILGGYFDNQLSQIIFPDFNQILFDLNHLVFTRNIVFKNNDWEKRLSLDMKRNEGIYTGRYVDYLIESGKYQDIQQAVQELETYIRLHIKDYPINPEYLFAFVGKYYNNKAVGSVNYNIKKYIPFYNTMYISE